mgnify:CR=1 FL=1
MEPARLGNLDAARLEMRGTLEHNPGRGTLFTVEGARVFVDFAHNPHGLEALLEMAAALPAASDAGGEGARRREEHPVGDHARARHDRPQAHAGEDEDVVALADAVGPPLVLHRVEGAAGRDDRAAVCPAHEVLGDRLCRELLDELDAHLVRAALGITGVLLVQPQQPQPVIRRHH